MTRKTKNIIKSIAFILVALFAIAMTLAYVGVFDRGGSASVYNEENLFNVADYTIENTEQDGITVTVNRAGQIKLEGECEAAEGAFITIPLQTIELEAGEYTINGLGDGSSDETYFLQNDGLIPPVMEDDVTFELTEDATITFSIVVFGGTEVDVVISPVLVEGDEAGSFFIVG